MTLLPEIFINLRQELATKQTKESAWKAIDEYFSFFGLEDVHNELWLLTAGTLTNEEMPSQKASDMHNLIFFFEYTKMFFEAVHLLHNKYKEE